VHASLRGTPWRQRQAWIALVSLVWLALGCQTTPTAPPAVRGYENYRVGAPDRLSVNILPDPVITRDVVVRPDGMISIDLIGDVPASGRTVDEIARDVEKRVARFKRGASATVAVAEARSTAVTILGEVRGNQTFPLLKETRVIEAIGMAGGTAPFASLRRVRVIRSQGSETSVMRVDLKAIQSGDLATNLVLMPGDVVYVPPTLLARFGYAVQAVLFPFQPLLGVATSVAGNAILPGRGN
jgi:polysaccharide export outer membrane protein